MARPPRPMCCRKLDDHEEIVPTSPVMMSTPSAARTSPETQADGPGVPPGETECS